MTDGTLTYEPRLGYFSDNAKVEAFGELYAKVFQLRLVSDLSPKNEREHGLVRSLVDMVRDLHGTEEAAQILQPQSDIQKKRAEVYGIFARAEADTAMFWAPQLRKADIPDFSRVGMFRDYIQQIENESLLCPIKRMVVNPHDKVLIIGAGALPLDAIHVVESTGKSVTCIGDKKAEVEAARDFIARMGYAKAISYHYASSQMYGLEKHPYVIINNSMINNFRVWETTSSAFFAEHIAVRQGNGIFATLYEALSPQLVEMQKINLLSNRVVVGSPDTMQSTLYANLNASPESSAKMALGGGREMYQYALHRLQEEQNRPGSMYLMPSHSWIKPG